MEPESDTNSIPLTVTSVTDPHLTLEHLKQQLEVAHTVTGRLLAENEELRTRYQRMHTRLVEVETYANEQRLRVRELEGADATNKLKELAGKIESEQRRLNHYLERKALSHQRIQQLQSLTGRFVTEAIEITDGIG